MESSLSDTNFNDVGIKKKVQLHVRIPEDVKLVLESLSQRYNVKISEVIELLVRKTSRILHILPKDGIAGNSPLEVITNIRVDDVNERERKPGEIWITDLSYCPLRYRLSLKYWNIIRYASIQEPRLLLGTLSHLGIELILAMYYDVEQEIRKEIEVEIEGEKRKFTLVGRADIIDRRNKIVYEVKTGSPKFIPQDHHILQVSFYATILGYKPVLIYITRDTLTEYEVYPDDVKGAVRKLPFGIDVDGEPFTEEWLISYVQRWINYNRPLWNWECEYCPVKRFCWLYKWLKEKEKV